jgi:hypothetical protein
MQETHLLEERIDKLILLPHLCEVVLAFTKEEE